MKRVLPEGYKVYITHFRKFEGESAYMTRFDAASEGFGSPLSKGGATEAVIVNPEGEVVSASFSSCNHKDHFNKKIGRDIATGRAIKKMENKVGLEP